MIGEKELHQKKLIAGDNIQINANTHTISATDTTYSAGTNINITNNIISATDTTYTAGNGITISDQNVISATGGGGTGLQYWTETQNEIYRYQANSVDGWESCNNQYVQPDVDYVIKEDIQNSQGEWLDNKPMYKFAKKEEGKAIIIPYRLEIDRADTPQTMLHNVFYGYMIFSTSAITSDSHWANANWDQTYKHYEWSVWRESSQTFAIEYLNMTWYVEHIIRINVGTEEDEGHWHFPDTGSTFSYATDAEFFADLEDVALKLLRHAGVRVTSQALTGIEVNSPLTFYSGWTLGNEITKDSCTFKVNRDGEIFGLEYYFNDDSEPFSEKFAKIDDLVDDVKNLKSGKQDKLTAGSNITINASNVISATDTTYNVFTGATLQADGTSGLVPGPQIADKNKYLKGDGTWATISESGEIIRDVTVDGTSVVDSQTMIAEIDLSSKQNALIAGANITIENNTISAMSSNDYSGLEEKCGTWIDGKNLYRLVIIVNDTFTNLAEDVNDLHIENLVNIDAVVANNGAVTKASVSGCTLSLLNNTITGTGNGTVKYLIIEYTKTTDVVTDLSLFMTDVLNKDETEQINGKYIVVDNAESGLRKYEV